MHRTPRLNYFTGNRLELLADRLASGLGQDPLAPGRPETIVVPSRGMGSWVTRELARRWGIAASLDLPFPDHFVDRVAAEFGLGRPAPVDPFRPRAQLWELHELFWKIGSGELQDDDLRAVRDHVQADPDGRKRYQLARRVAALFSAYQFARPEQVRRWDAGAWFGDLPAEDVGEIWQRGLWQRLCAAHAGVRPPASRLLELVGSLDRGEFEPDWLPERVSVFGASTLPPMIVQVLVALSAHRPVDFYLLVPTPAYLADLRSRRERERRADPVQLSPAEELVGELGRLGREFFESLLDLDPTGAAFGEAGFADPGSGTTLHHLQSALKASGSDPLPPPTADPQDGSLRLHSCHSPLREMEVLRDEVLTALADGAANSVADVLLLVPDIRTYAPFARSVFGAAIDNGDGTLQLPVRVADRVGATDQPFARLVLQWLELASARLTVSEVFPLLHETVVRSRFDLSEDQLETLRDRLVEAGVIWGVDPVTRARQTGSPEFTGVSWREGIDRLLLGCFTGPVEETVAGILPAADATVSETAALGRLATALDRLFFLLGELAGPWTVAEWAQRLRAGLLEQTDVSAESDADQRARCIAVLDQLQTDAASSKAPVGRLALLDLLRREFEAMDTGAGFVSGCVTVAELRPMRSLPAGVIAVAGLDAGSFPRAASRDGLDLIVHAPRRGDRTPRDDDRQLFLELLLCARERLILSWVGRSQVDDRERTVSPCVQELIDALAALGTPVEVTQHSLQPFTGIDCKEKTYDHALVGAARALESPGPVSRFVDTRVDPPLRPRVEHIALEDLREFWTSPSAWFCRRVLELSLRRDREEAAAESFRLDDLQKWRVRDLALRGGGLVPDEERLRARLALPAHELMTLELDLQRAGLAELERALGYPLASLRDEPVEVEGVDFVVSGNLPRDGDGGLVEIVAASALREKYRVRGLVAHIAACCAGEVSASTVAAAGRPSELKSWKRLDDPQEALALLVEGYRLGQLEPLRFYPRTSLVFARELARGGDQDPVGVFRSGRVLESWARPVDDAEHGNQGECFDEAVALCTRGLGDPEICDDHFRRWATRFSGWLEAVEKKR